MTMELPNIFLPLSLSHPFGKFEVFLCHRLIVLEVAAGPSFFACFCCMQLAFFVAVGVLLAFTRASQSLLVFEFLFDAGEHAAALRAHELCSSTSLVIL